MFIEVGWPGVSIWMFMVDLDMPSCSLRLWCIILSCQLGTLFHADYNIALKVFFFQGANSEML